MKRLCTSFLIVLISVSLIKAQHYRAEDFGDTKKFSNFGKIIKISPLQFFYGNMPLTGEYGFSVEQKAGLHTSFQGDIAYLGNGLLYLMAYTSDTTQTTQQERITMIGFRAQAAYRIYIGKKFAPQSWYFAPHISYARARYSTATARQSNFYIQATHIDYSFILGHQFIWGRFAMDINAGITYRQRYWAEKNYQTAKPLSQQDIEDMYIFTGTIRPKIGFSLGRTF